MTFLRCFVAELSKLRRTPALLVVLLAPYLMALLTFLVIFFHSERILPAPHVDSWTYLARTSFGTWCLVFLPIFVGLVTSLAAAVEHRSGGFRHLFALPVGRWTIYTAKQSMGALLVAASLGLLVAGLLLAGTALKILRPGFGFEDPVPWGLLLQLVVAVAAAAAWLTALQTWIALLTDSVAGPIAVSLLATVSLLSLRAFDPDSLAFHPWAYPGEVARRLSHGEEAWTWALTGLFAGVLFAAYSGWSYCRRDVP